MELTKQIAQQFREVFLTGKWVVQTNFKEQLVDVDWKQATTSIDSLNTIAALTYHVGYYVGGILNVFNGGTLDIQDKYSFDLPPIESQQDWEKIKNKFFVDAEQFADRIEQMTEQELNDIFVKEEYGNNHFTIDILIEHTYYHLGQIVLIKKLMSQKDQL